VRGGGPDPASSGFLPFFQCLGEIAKTCNQFYALSGQVRQALPLLEQAMQLSEAMGIKATQALGVAALSEASLLAGRRDEALPLAGRALACSSDLKQHGHQAWILRLLGEIAAHRHPPEAEQTEASYRQALSLAEELDMRPLQAHCHRGLGLLYAATGQSEQARGCTHHRH
jgi:tetratricopeptide (TPR) repeat protein